jgi:hypothetical protein
MGSVQNTGRTRTAIARRAVGAREEQEREQQEDAFDKRGGTPTRACAQRARPDPPDQAPGSTGRHRTPATPGTSPGVAGSRVVRRSVHPVTMGDHGLVVGPSLRQGRVGGGTPT